MEHTLLSWKMLPTTIEYWYILSRYQSAYKRTFLMIVVHSNSNSKMKNTLSLVVLCALAQHIYSSSPSCQAGKKSYWLSMYLLTYRKSKFWLIPLAFQPAIWKMPKFEDRILHNIFFDLFTTAHYWEKNELLTNKIRFLSFEQSKIKKYYVLNIQYSNFSIYQIA